MDNITSDGWSVVVGSIAVVLYDVANWQKVLLLDSVDSCVFGVFVSIVSSA